MKGSILMIRLRSGCESRRNILDSKCKENQAGAGLGAQHQSQKPSKGDYFQYQKIPALKQSLGHNELRKCSIIRQPSLRMRIQAQDRPRERAGALIRNLQLQHASKLGADGRSSTATNVESYLCIQSKFKNSGTHKGDFINFMNICSATSQTSLKG